MAKLSKLAIFWYIMVTPVVLIDGIFVLNRAPANSPNPRHPLADTIPFSYWTIYERYDRRYAPNDDAFVVAQSYLNLLEVFLGLVILFLALCGAQGSAIKLSIVVSMMTLYKTILYFVMDIAEGGKFTKHNSFQDNCLMVLLPSSFWILVPGIILYQCFSSLTLKSAPEKKAKSSKKKKN